MHEPATRVRPSARRLLGSAAALVTVVGLGAPMALADPASGAAPVTRAALAPGSINHIVVIELENEGYNTTFGPGSVATYLNGVLRKQGELLANYYATGHASLDNYISQVSGQSPTQSTQADCLANGAAFVDVTPGSASPSGQVQGQGCVYPPSVPTIASQLDSEVPTQSQDPCRRLEGLPGGHGQHAIPGRRHSRPDRGNQLRAPGHGCTHGSGGHVG